jgi:protein gp37
VSDKTRIEWADASWNPVRGCSRVSEGCRNCYAEAQAARFGHKLHDHVVAENTPNGPRWVRGAVGLVQAKLHLPLAWKEPRRVFVNSMSDLFHEALLDHEIASVFRVMATAHQHQFLVLTKRPQRMMQFCRTKLQQYLEPGSYVIAGAGDQPGIFVPNVWLGTSTEDQLTADERIPYLLSTPAAIRFVSVEPMIGPVTLRPRPRGERSIPRHTTCLLCGEGPAAAHVHEGGYRSRGLDWVIVGGESGSRRRALDLEWLHAIVRECEISDVPIFVKQDSALQPGTKGRIPDEIWALKQFPALAGAPA